MAALVAVCAVGGLLVKDYDIGDEDVSKVQEDLLSALKRLASDWDTIRRGLAVKSFLKSLLLPFVCLIPVRRARRRRRAAAWYSSWLH